MQAPPEHIGAASGAAGGSIGLVLLQMVPNQDFVTKALMLGAVTIVTSFLTTRGVALLNKVSDAPTKEMFDKHVGLLETVNHSLEKFLSAHGEWKISIEHRISKLEDEE